MDDRTKAETFYWQLVIVFFAFWIPMAAVVQLQMDIRHSYEYPTIGCKNDLTSDRGTWEYIREALIPMFLLVPLSGLFMIWSRSGVGRNTHVVILFIGFVWGISMLGYDIRDIGTANLPPNNDRFNPNNLARDKRYCLYYAGQPGTELICHLTAPCAMGPAVDPLSFKVDGPFAFRVGWLAYILVHIIVDYIFTIGTWKIVLKTPK
jgi:hypothetical protein